MSSTESSGHFLLSTVKSEVLYSCWPLCGRPVYHLPHAVEIYHGTVRTVREYNRMGLVRVRNGFHSEKFLMF